MNLNVQKVSVITPVHRTSAPFLLEAYWSLVEQTYQDWEWIVLLNDGGWIHESIGGDRRMRVELAEEETGEGGNRIGRLKREACSYASGEILVELDADDILLPDALERIVAAFEDPGVQMVYSNSAEFWHDTWQPHLFSSETNWQYRPFVWNGHELVEHVAWPATVHAMRFIYYAPDHVRAWRRGAYWQVGGHDSEMAVADDHDLCCRFYLAYGEAGFRHIDRCLYLYRRHEHNSFVDRNEAVQVSTLRNYLKYSRDMMVRWARDEGLQLVDLGGRFNAWPGFVTVDLEDADLIVDLNERWPFEDGTVGVLKAHHIFEHLTDPIHAMNEAYRVLAPGGWLLLEVPSTDGRGAFQDPTHRSFWNENSIWYYTRSEYARFIQPAYQGRFQVSRVATHFPFGEDVPVVQADLIALKAPYDERPVGSAEI